MNTEEKDNQRINNEAAEWAARRLSGLHDPHERKALNAWLEADHRHEIAFAEYMMIAETSALAGAVAGEQIPANDGATHMEMERPRRRNVLIAAVPAIAACVAAAFFILPPQVESPADVDRYVTTRGEMREIALADGTVVTLNTDSALEVSFSDGERHAKLGRGEAFFDVARDESRPFIVATGHAQATVLGTRFSVREMADETLVCVHSGLVGVASRAQEQDAQQMRLVAGQAVEIAADGEASAVSTFNPASDATWRKGYLLFDQTPLRDVIGELNRYFDRQIFLSDASLGDDPVSGRIEIGDQDVAVHALGVALGLHVDSTGRDELILSRND